MWIPWNILPISVVFYVHHQTYSKIIKANRVSTGSSDSGGDNSREIKIDPSAFNYAEPYEAFRNSSDLSEAQIRIENG